MSLTASRPSIRAGAALMLAGVLITAGCTHGRKPGRTTTTASPTTVTTRPRTSLAGTGWTLVPSSLGVPVPAGVSPTLSFGTDGRIGGSSGCNELFGTAEIDRIVSGMIEVRDLSGHSRGCADDVMAVEDRFLALLAAAESYDVVGDELRLWGPAGSVRFRRFGAAPASDAVVGAWTVTTFRDSGTGTVRAPLSADPLGLRLADDGTGAVSICWSSLIEWSTSGDAIVIRISGGVDTECTDPQKRIDEPSVLAAIDGSRRWSLDGDTLTLSTGTGQVTLTARRAPSAG